MYYNVRLNSQLWGIGMLKESIVLTHKAMNGLRFDAQSSFDATFRLLQEILDDNIPLSVANALGLHPNTVERWVKNCSVPKHYYFDFLRILGKNDEILRAVASTPRDKDQFYTKPQVAKHCVERLHQVARELHIDLSEYFYIEPAAGCGWFYGALPEERRIGIDIDPRALDLDGERLIHADYLQWRPPNANRKFVVVGNPPFGLRGHLALQFMNHSADFADIVAFILPQLFESDGKGVPAKRVDSRYRLAHRERLAPDSFMYPDGKSVNISTVFQVWTAVNTEFVERESRKTCNTYIKVYSLSDGGTPASTRNKNMIGKCDVYLPSTCFSNMQAFLNYEELPHRRGYGLVIYQDKEEITDALLRNNWEQTAFPSTNGALNLRTSLIENVVIEAGYFD